MLDEPEAGILVVYDPGMKLIMNDNNLTKLGDVSAFLEGTLLIEFKDDSQKQRFLRIICVKCKLNLKVETTVCRKTPHPSH